MAAATINPTAEPTPRPAHENDSATSLATQRPNTPPKWVYVLPFGEYRGRPISEVPRDYLIYLLRGKKRGEEMRDRIITELNRRANTGANNG